MLARCQTCNARVSVMMHGEYTFGDPREGPPVKALLASCAECYQPMFLGAERYGLGVDDEDDAQGSIDVG